MAIDNLCIIYDFLNYDPLSQLMQGATVAVLTLLISFAIGIFIHHLGDGERKGSFLDLHIALDYVWLFKPSLFVLAVAVISPFFMGIGGIDFKAFIFATWAISLAVLFWLLLRLYWWVKGDKDEYRRNYLGDFPKSPRDEIISWGDFWATDTTTSERFLEKDFFLSFSARIDELIVSDSKDCWDILLKLLDGYVRNIQKRNKVFIVVFPEFFPKILDWHFILWEKQYSEFSIENKVDNAQIDQQLFRADELVIQMIHFVTREALVGPVVHAHSYFKALEEHVKQHESASIKGEKHTYQYIEVLPIYEDCFSLIPKSKASYDIWSHYFPKTWKITVDNLEAHPIASVWFYRFVEWSRSRLWRNEKGWDEELEEISKELFPNVDPMTWAKVLTFVLSSWSGSRIKDAVERDINFGLVGRVFSGWGENVEQEYAKAQEAEIQNTIELATYLFPGIFKKESLRAWIQELEQIDYQQDSKLQGKAAAWTALLKALLTRVESEKSE